MKKFLGTLVATFALLLAANTYTAYAANEAHTSRESLPFFQMELSEGLKQVDSIPANATLMSIHRDESSEMTRSLDAWRHTWLAGGRVTTFNLGGFITTPVTRTLFIDINIPAAGANWVQGTITITGDDGTQLRGNISNFANDWTFLSFQGRAGVRYWVTYDMQHIGTGSGVNMQHGIFTF